MPKRTNQFQHLVALIETSLHDGNANVQESKELKDKITAKPREVDIIISVGNSVHDFTIGVECKGGLTSPRAATTEWVEQMWGKHTNLPTDKLVLVAKGGFTSNAIKKGEFLGVECLTLEAAKKLDWEAKIRGIPSLEFEFFLRPYVTDIDLILPPESQEALESGDIPISEFDKLQLKLFNGNAVFAIEVVNKWINDPSFIQKLEQHAYTDSGTIFKFERDLKSGTCIVGKSGSNHAIHAIRVKGKCHKNVGKIDFEHQSFKGAAIAHLRHAFLDKEFDVVMTEKEGEAGVITVSATKKKT